MEKNRFREVYRTKYKTVLRRSKQMRKDSKTPNYPGALHGLTGHHHGLQVQQLMMDDQDLLAARAGHMAITFLFEVQMMSANDADPAGCLPSYYSG